MDSHGGRIVSDLVGELEAAWNAADGTRFAQSFAEDADFVNIRGEHLRTREVIAKGHQAIFNTIYKGSVVHYDVTGVRAIAPAVLVAHVKSTLKAPTGPLAGEHNSLFTLVLVQHHNSWSIAAFHNTLITQGAAGIDKTMSEIVQQIEHTVEADVSATFAWNFWSNVANWDDSPAEFI